MRQGGRKAIVFTEHWQTPGTETYVFHTHYHPRPIVMAALGGSGFSIPILQMGKPRLCEFNCCAKGQTLVCLLTCSSNHFFLNWDSASFSITTCWLMPAWRQNSLGFYWVWELEICENFWVERLSPRANTPISKMWKGLQRSSPIFLPFYWWEE